jgi:hypothetical protein
MSWPLSSQPTSRGTFIYMKSRSKGKLLIGVLLATTVVFAAHQMGAALPYMLMLVLTSRCEGGLPTRLLDATAIQYGIFVLLVGFAVARVCLPIYAVLRLPVTSRSIEFLAWLIFAFSWGMPMPFILRETVQSDEVSDSTFVVTAHRTIPYCPWNIHISYESQTEERGLLGGQITHLHGGSIALWAGTALGIALIGRYSFLRRKRGQNCGGA